MIEPFSRGRLLSAWLMYRRGKRRVPAVAAFDAHIEEEIESLAHGLENGTYRHGPYRTFSVCDPKRRTITAAALRDRLVHQVVYEEVERAFEPTFLDCSYSGRKGRGVHAAVDAAERAIAALRSQGAWPVYALKLDVRKFYDSLDHVILQRLLARRIHDPRMLDVIACILASHVSSRGIGKGIPIGNLTSQIFANVYLHELDRFAKHTLRLACYLRYADDVLLLGADRTALDNDAAMLGDFIQTSLALRYLPLPSGWPRKLSQGVDWLGKVLWPYGQTLRRATRGRMRQNLRQCEREVMLGERAPESLAQVRASCRGVLKRVRDRVLAKRIS